MLLTTAFEEQEILGRTYDAYFM